MANGSFSQTLEGVTCLAEGTVGLPTEGEIDQILDDVVCAATGTVMPPIGGNIGQLLEDVVCLAEGSVFVEGTIDQILEDATCLAAGTVTTAPDVNAALNQMLENVVCLANGTVTTPPPEDISWFKLYAQKKVESYFAVDIVEQPVGDIIPDIQSFATDNYHLANIPKHSIITNAYAFVKTPVMSTGAVAIDLGTSEGANDVLVGANLTLLGKQGVFPGKQLNAAQVPLFATVTNNGSPIFSSKGNFVIVVEYFEYKLNSGEYTPIDLEDL